MPKRIDGHLLDVASDRQASATGPDSGTARSSDQDKAQATPSRPPPQQQTVHDNVADDDEEELDPMGWGFSID